MISTHFIPHTDGTSTRYSVVTPIQMTPFVMLLEIIDLIVKRNIQEGDLLLIKITDKEELKEKFFIYTKNNFGCEFVRKFKINLRQIDKTFTLKSIIHVKRVDISVPNMFETIINVQNAHDNAMV